LDIGLVPAGVSAKAFILRERISLGKLNANWGEHRPAVADVGTRKRSLLAWLKDWTIGTVEGKYAREKRVLGA
jgi:hypothetical protein